MESFWLRDSPYIQAKEPSIADLQFSCELEQLCLLDKVRSNLPSSEPICCLASKLVQAAPFCCFKNKGVLESAHESIESFAVGLQFL
jgi:hypothetical protein